MEIISVISYILACIMALGWQIEWLDKYFLWRFAADIIGFITIPLFPIYTIIEWLWHGWPSDVTIAIYFGAIGVGIRAMEYLLNLIIFKSK
jgi:hypothetical protein